MDIFDCEDTYFGLPQNIPLLGLAIGVTAMVYKTGHVPLVSGIDHLSTVKLHHVSTGGVGVLIDPTNSLLGVEAEHLTDVLKYKLSLSYKLTGNQSKAFAIGGFRVDARILMQLEAPVLAGDATGTGIGLALRRHLPIETPLPAVNADIWVLPLLLTGVETGNAVTLVDVVLCGHLLASVEEDVLFDDDVLLQTLSQVLDPLRIRF